MSRPNNYDWTRKFQLDKPCPRKCGRLREPGRVYCLECTRALKRESKVRAKERARAI